MCGSNRWQGVDETEHFKALGFEGLSKSGELLLQSSRLSIQKPDHPRVLLYNMESASFRGSDEIVLPPEYASLNDDRLKLLASYKDSIVPLR
ncbi:hypothetical protein GBA52_021057 [Prunus armeniaca]|nr:hypothetical protein GBA52_021057 [Prunus armeniaca]